MDKSDFVPPRAICDRKLSVYRTLIRTLCNSLRGDEGGEMSVFGVKGYTVVAVPCVNDGFLLPLRDGFGLVEE